MAKIVALDPPTLAWSRRLFAEYYRSVAPAPPPRLGRREFAAFPFAAETLMRRHAAFRTPEEFHEFLRREAPRHVYYSTAYYRRPDAPTMAEKEWLGADLIFDLDADHLRGAESLDYARQLELVKERLRALVDDFLLGDFGIDPGAMEIVFSGGRGYHVHVREERFLPLSSPERRELVEYLSATGFDLDSVVSRQREASDSDAEEDAPRRGRAAAPTRLLAPPDASGWKGRTSRALFALLERWESVGADEAEREIVAMGFSKPKAHQWAKALVTDHGARRLREDPTRAVPAALVPEELLTAVLQRAEIVVQGETDAPVTTDIHRLIRLPGSLHGGTGFRVRPIEYDALGRFDPFRDAAIELSGRTRVLFHTSAEYPFPGKPLRLEAGESAEVPTPQALFLILRGEAALPPSPG